MQRGSNSQTANIRAINIYANTWSSIHTCLVQLKLKLFTFARQPSLGVDKIVTRASK